MVLMQATSLLASPGPARDCEVRAFLAECLSDGLQLDVVSEDGVIAGGLPVRLHGPDDDVVMAAGPDHVLVVDDWDRLARSVPVRDEGDKAAIAQDRRRARLRRLVGHALFQRNKVVVVASEAPDIMLVRRGNRIIRLGD